MHLKELHPNSKTPGAPICVEKAVTSPHRWERHVDDQGQRSQTEHLLRAPAR
jgi:hypothetical protein